MHTDIKNNTQEIASPPLPPAAVFDERRLAEAQPVQPLSNRQPHKLAAGFQQILGRLTAIAPMIAGIIICVGIGAASVDLDSRPLSSKDDTAQSASEPLAPTIATPTSNGSAVKNQKRRTFSHPQVRETLPPFEFNEGEDDRKPKARMVSVIH